MNNLVIQLDMLTEPSVAAVSDFLIPLQNTPFDVDQGLYLALFRHLVSVFCRVQSSDFALQFLLAQ